MGNKMRHWLKHNIELIELNTTSWSLIFIDLKYFSILHINVFQLHKIQSNCISITKYKLLLSRPQNTKYFKCIENTCISITCISITPTLLIIIRYCCCKHCELLLNRFLIKDLHPILNLLRYLPLSSIIDDKIRPPTPFSTPCGKKFQPSYLFSQPTTYKKSRPPHLHFDNSITEENDWVS